MPDSQQRYRPKSFAGKDSRPGYPPPVDVFTPEKRSEVMSRVRSAGTDPERRLHAIVREVLGHRWRIDSNVRTLPGCPDIVVPSLNLALFADGCFFHACPQHGELPQSNVEFWASKLEANARRDRRQSRLLRTTGMSVWRVWEHDLRARTAPATALQLERRLRRRVQEVRRQR